MSMSYRQALKCARLMALEGPRVAAIFLKIEKGVRVFEPAPGYHDGLEPLPLGSKFKQIALVTPDGRVWRTRRVTKSRTLDSLLAECMAAGIPQPPKRKKNGRKPR